MFASFFKSPRAPKGPKSSPLVEYRLGIRFDPGAQAEVFEEVLTNPIYLYRGSGRVAGHLAPVQPPMVWFGPQVTPAGLGGIQAGQFVGQSLIDPSQLEN